MKQHSTNYTDTFIEVAPDCPVLFAEIPPSGKNNKSLALLQFEILWENPYKFTSDDVLFSVFAIRNHIPEDELEEARHRFFSKGQPCFRASPLTKRYGWGIHSNEEGKIALYACESLAYQKLRHSPLLTILKAMRSKK